MTTDENEILIGSGVALLQGLVVFGRDIFREMRKYRDLKKKARRVQRAGADRVALFAQSLLVFVRVEGRGALIFLCKTGDRATFSEGVFFYAPEARSFCGPYSEYVEELASCAPELPRMWRRFSALCMNLASGQVLDQDRERCMPEVNEALQELVSVLRFIIILAIQADPRRATEWQEFLDADARYGSLPLLLGIDEERENAFRFRRSWLRR